MKSFSLRSALIASTLLLAGNLPTATAQLETKIGCFSSSKSLEDQGSYTYQSNGYCLDLCYKAQYSVFALTGGDHCLCGNTLPPESSELKDDSQCNTPCAAWPIVMCGGSNAYSVYLTGLKPNATYYGASTTTTNTDSDTSTTTETGPTATSTQTKAFVTAAAAATSSTDEPKKSGPNTAAIAAGVVVGVVGLCALIGAGFFLWRFKTRHPADQRLREMNNVERFGAKPMSQGSMSDSRFDPDFMAQRRQSNGSIDDDQDFSRRILQVTNPDRL